MNVMRYAEVRGAGATRTLRAYLPGNYRVIAGPMETPAYDGAAYSTATWVIGGRDAAGWTLDGYVIPRLASGIITASEIDLSHPLMREVPATASMDSEVLEALPNNEWLDIHEVASAVAGEPTRASGSGLESSLDRLVAAGDAEVCHEQDSGYQPVWRRSDA
jgi:hypothetical protein